MTPPSDISQLMIAAIEDYAIFMLDTDGIIRSWNRGAEIIKGYTPEQIIGQSFEVFYTPEDRQAGIPQTYLREAITMGHVQHEGWRLRRSGDRYWAHVTITALLDGERRLIGFSTVTRDLTTQKKEEEARKKIEGILDRTSRVARIGAWEVDFVRDRVIWSAVTKQIHGVSPDYEPDLETAINFFKEGESREIMRHVFQQAVTHGTPYDIELILVTAQGREIWCRSVAQAEFKDGRCVSVYGIFQDIDDQKRMQIQMQLSEEQFRTSFDLSGMGMALVSTDGRPIRVNQRLCDILGYTHQECYALSIIGITHPDDREADIASARQLFDGQIDRYQIIKRYYHKNGSIVWARVTVSLVRDAQRKPVHFVSEVEDITETKKAEDDLKHVNDELTAIFDSGTHVSIIGTDLNGIITHFNKGAEELFGYTAAEVVGIATPEIIQAGDALARRSEELTERFGKEIKGFDALVEPTRQDGYEAKEVIYRRKDGTTFTAHAVITPIKNELDQIIGFLGISTDITQMKEAEASIRKYALLEAKNKEMEQFTFIASHDLLEPLQTVSSFVSLLREDYDEKLDADARKYIHFISGATRRMMELVKGLLHYSRLGRERRLEHTDIGELLRAVLEDLDLMIADSGARITVGPMPRLEVYPVELSQLFQNLVANAIKFRKPDQPLMIDISAQCVNNNWTFVVADNGIGIAEKNQDKIFVIFQRLHDRHEYEGIGIGLAYCKKIVEMHNGNIWVESAPGVGSSFYFTIMT